MMTCPSKPPKRLGKGNNLHGWMPRGLVSPLELGRFGALVEDIEATAVQTRPDPAPGSGRRKLLILLRKRRRRPAVQIKKVLTRIPAHPHTCRRVSACLRACVRACSNTYMYWTAGRLDKVSIHAASHRPDPMYGLDGFAVLKGNAMSQTIKRPDLRAEMPETAKWVDAKRLQWGVEHVNDCIKRALAGTPGLFYAIESGKVLGTPFPATHVMAQYQGIAIVTGCTFAGFMADRPVHGAH